MPRVHYTDLTRASCWLCDRERGELCHVHDPRMRRYLPDADAQEDDAPVRMAWARPGDLPMPTQSPVLDVFLDRHGPAWRLYLSPDSWCPPMIQRHLGDHREAFPVAEPDLANLDKLMWAADAPYDKTIAKSGAVQVVARGRSAAALLPWLEGLVEDAR